MLILLVAVMTAPAMADVTITVSDNADGTADIDYACTGGDLSAVGKSLMAGIALVVTVDAADTISAITNYKADGESTIASPGYGVYMEEAQVYDTAGYGWNNGVGDPIADPCDPGTVGGIGTNSIVLELGALYDATVATGDPCNAPDASGTLCTIAVTDGATALVDIELEDAYRGGIAMEVGVADPCATLVDGAITSGVVECFDSGHADYTEWQNVGEPDCWCYKYQCQGDGDGSKQGTIKTGIYRVSFADLTILLDGWQKDATDTAFDICADFDRAEQGTIKTGIYRVSFADLTILLDNWQDDTNVTGGCGGTVDLTP